MAGSIAGVMTVWNQLEPLLGQVQKPARYIGCEDGAQTPEHTPESMAWLLAYPDTYEIGLPNQGLQILYEIVNERADGVAERTYAPWTDMEHQLRSYEIPLFSVDSHRPASDFDILAFNVSAELTYTNVLNMVDLAGCPVRSAERVYRHRREDETLPWDHLSAGLHKDFLWQEWRDALAEVGSPQWRRSPPTPPRCSRRSRAASGPWSSTPWSSTAWNPTRWPRP